MPSPGFHVTCSGKEGRGKASKGRGKCEEVPLPTRRRHLSVSEMQIYGRKHKRHYFKLKRVKVSPKPPPAFLMRSLRKDGSTGCRVDADARVGGGKTYLCSANHLSTKSEYVAGLAAKCEGKNRRYCHSHFVHKSRGTSVKSHDGDDSDIGTFSSAETLSLARRRPRWPFRPSDALMSATGASFWLACPGGTLPPPSALSPVVCKDGEISSLRGAIEKRAVLPLTLPMPYT